MNLAENFLLQTEEKSANTDFRKTLDDNVTNYQKQVDYVLPKFYNLEISKKKAHFTKWRTIENLDKLLPYFETNFQKRGGKVIWANDANEANQEILRIIQQHQDCKVITSSSNTLDEIKLIDSLKINNIDVHPSDFAGLVLQYLDQQRSHPVNVLLHLKKDEIIQIFVEKFGMDKESTAEQIIQKAKSIVRENLKEQTIGITGANFLVAETGSVVLVENEGDIRLMSASVKVHICVVGIDKIIPSMHDLGLYLPLLSSYSTGQTLSAYHTILNGPRQSTETDGPDEMYVVFLDNGRTNVLEKEEQRQALYCINCGACHNTSQVFRTIGGQAYPSTKTGPIGSLSTPLSNGMKTYQFLNFAMPLNGKSSDVCPINIEIDKMILLNRRDSVQQNLLSFKERWIWKLWKKCMNNRKWLDFFGYKTKNRLLKYITKKTWGNKLELPKVADKTFSQKWVEIQKSKEIQK